jgi:DNA ligase-associated metallophosphoesterase
VKEVVEIRGELLELLPQKAIFWKKKKMLLLADLHLGKATHFRNNGIAIPTKVNAGNWESLRQLIETFAPERVCFLGDLFHSTYNKEWEVFQNFIKQYGSVRFELIVGNHDILTKRHYDEAGLKQYSVLKEDPFVFSHEPMEDSKLYNLAGHIHPGAYLKGKGRQGLRVPCFFFSPQAGLLPAFGSFTGLATVKVKKQDKVFGVVNNCVVAMN